MNTTKSKRITVLCSADELYKVDALTLIHFGATRPEILRLGIDALAGAPPPVVLQPQVLPLPMLKSTFSNLNNLTRSIDAAVRNGWPDHIPGETTERKEMVEEARSEFKRVLEELKPLRNDLFLKLTACAVLPTANVPLLLSATEYLKKWLKYLEQRIADDSNTIALAQKVIDRDCIQHLFILLVMLGLDQNPPKGNAAPIMLDIATLRKAVGYIERDIASRRESIKAGKLSPKALAWTTERVAAFEHLVAFLNSILTIKGTSPRTK
jgi:hypothetical protein